MPPERDIEKELRAYAAKRREDAGARFGIHPATRRLLRDEAVRTHGKHPAANGESLLRKMISWQWPPLAWVSSVLVILAVGTWAYLGMHPPKKSVAVASLSETAGYVQGEIAPVRRLDAPAKSVVAGVDNSVPIATLARGKGVESKDRIAATEPAPVIVAPAAPPVEPAREKTEANKTWAFSDGKEIAKDADRLQFEVVTNSASLGMLASQSHATTSQLLDNKSVVQNAFYRNEAQIVARGGTSGFVVGGKMAGLERSDARDAVKAKTAAMNSAQNVLLNSFQVEQNGNAIRIIDGDGSVYTGKLLAMDAAAENGLQVQQDVLGMPTAKGSAANQMAKRDRELRQTVVAGGSLQAANAELSQIQNFRFVAAGTNVTLKQNIVVSGELLNESQSAANGESVTNQSASQSVGNSSLISNSRIVGRAVTGDGQEIEINAAQATP